MKYEFTGETKIEFGVTLRRIRALVEIKAACVAKGDLGGWIETEGNLSQVYGDAAWVYGNAQVSGNAQVYGNTRVCKPIIAATRSDGYTFTLCARENAEPVIIAGCRYFTLAEARAHWQRTRAGTPLGDETFSILDHFERMAAINGMMPVKEAAE